MLLLEQTDDSIEIAAVSFARGVGAFLAEIRRQIIHCVVLEGELQVQQWLSKFFRCLYWVLLHAKCCERYLRV